MEEQKAETEETKVQEPEHTYRLHDCTGQVAFIMADDMHIDDNGFTRLFVRKTVSGTDVTVPDYVAILHPGVTVIRVDMLVNWKEMGK